MSREVSIGTKLEQVHGLLGTNDLTEWEQDFVRSVWAWSGQGWPNFRASRAWL